MDPDQLPSPSRHPPHGLAFGVPILALLLLVPLELWTLDHPLFYWFNRLPEYTGPAFWAHITVLGDGLVCAVLLLPWIRRHPDRVWSGILGAIVMFIVLRSFKASLAQPRPLGVLPVETVNVIGPGHRLRAFPSGHTATFALYAGILALTTRRRLVSAAALALATLVGVSRMAVGVHWPSDVLAGLALGWISAWVGLRWGARASWGTGPTGRRILAGALLISAVVLLLIDHTGYPGVAWFQRGLALVCLAWGTTELMRYLRAPSSAEPGPDTGA